MSCSSSGCCAVLGVVAKCIDKPVRVFRRILFMMGGKGESCDHSREVVKEISREFLDMGIGEGKIQKPPLGAEVVWVK